MEKLADHVKRNGYNYFLVKRNENVAVYAQHFMEREGILSYEVFIIKKQKEGIITRGGVEIPLKAKELFPNNENFGQTAWSIRNKEEALQRFNELTEKVEENLLNPSKAGRPKIAPGGH